MYEFMETNGFFIKVTFTHTCKNHKPLNVTVVIEQVERCAQ